MAKATALARARRVRQHPKPKPQSAQIGPDGPQHPGNRQLYDKRGRPDAGLRLHPHHATFNVATFCAALWSNFTLPLTSAPGKTPVQRTDQHIGLNNGPAVKAAWKSNAQVATIISTKYAQGTRCCALLKGSRAVQSNHSVALYQVGQRLLNH
jgi:hypothetical protein